MKGRRGRRKKEGGVVAGGKGKEGGVVAGGKGGWRRGGRS